jgi:hypothetical protein
MLFVNADYCRERADTCRESAFGIVDDEHSAGWLYLADLWDDLAQTAEQRPTIH